MFYWFWFDFGSPLGAMLATYSVSMGVRCGVLPSFCLGRCSYLRFLPSWPPSWEKCRVPPLDFGRFWARFWNVLGSILEVSGDYFSGYRCPFSSYYSNYFNEFSEIRLALRWSTFYQNLVWDELVGLRGAQRITKQICTRASVGSAVLDRRRVTRRLGRNWPQWA